MSAIPYHGEIWLPGYLKYQFQRLTQRRPPAERVWMAIMDHYEPLWKRPDAQTAQARVDYWKKRWPEIAARNKDSMGYPAKYSFFFPQEEYRVEFLDVLAKMTHSGIADVEVHIHHDGEGEEDFLSRMQGFIQVLHNQHGLLRRENGKIVFGFIHGNWTLDNSHPSGRYCGLNNEISLLRNLGCYADFTLPSAPEPMQTRMVNQIYWATDDPSRPKSHDMGTAALVGGNRQGDLLMIPGPLGFSFRSNRRWKNPRLETGELAAYDLPTIRRVRAWLDLSPRLGGDIFVKLFTHGANERNAKALLEGALDTLFVLFRAECQRRGLEFRYVSAWEMYTAVNALVCGNDPVGCVEQLRRNIPG